MSDSYRVVKTNRFGRDQERVLSLDFNSGSIVNKNTKGKVRLRSRAPPRKSESCVHAAEGRRVGQAIDNWR